MPRALFLSGYEIHAPELPDDVRVVHPPAPGMPLTDVKAATLHALNNPVAGPRLADRVHGDDRVLVVFDGPAFPVPPMRADPRAPAIAAILETLASAGLALDQVQLLCASGGAVRRYRNTELSAVAGVAALASHHAACHDAEDGAVVEIGTTEEGDPIELNAALTQVDLVITVSLAQGPLHGGHTTLVGGLCSARTARALYSPRHLSEGPTHFDPREGKLHQALRRAGELVEKRLPLFHVELAVDTRLLAKSFTSLLEPTGGLHAPAQAWNLLPLSLRRRATRLARADYQTVSVFAGPTAAVHLRTVQALQEVTSIPVQGRSDVVVLGVPAGGPHTAGASDNPLLAATFAFGYLLAWHRGGPLFRDGGAVVLMGTFDDSFDRSVHQPHAEFFERVLAKTRDPRELADQFEGSFASREDLIDAYRHRFAYHPLHPFHRWYRAAGTLARCGKVFAVGAHPDVAARLGFSASESLDKALAEAREFAGGAKATVSALAMPPAFGVSVR